MYETAEAASRAGVSTDELGQLVEQGIVKPNGEGLFSSGDVRRVGMVRSLVSVGIPLDGLGVAMRNGHVSLDFLDAPAFERFSALSGVTFAQFAERTGAPIHLLTLIRESAGSTPPLPDDQIRDDELPYAEFIAAQVEAGFRPAAIQQLLRVTGDSLRRMAETESAWWGAEVMQPATEAGKRPDEVLGGDIGNRLSRLSEQAVIGMYHLQQTQAWSAGIIEGASR